MIHEENLQVQKRLSAIKEWDKVNIIGNEEVDGAILNKNRLGIRVNNTSHKILLVTQVDDMKK